MANTQIELTTDKNNSVDLVSALAFDSIERGKVIDTTINDVDGNPFNLSDLTVKFIEAKENGKVIVDDNQDRFSMQDTGQFSYTLPEQAYNSSGWCKFELWKDDNKIDTTNYFQIAIRPVSDEPVSDDSDYISSLDNLTGQYNSLLDKLNRAITDGKTDFGNAISEAQSQLKDLISDTEDKLSKITDYSSQVSGIEEQLTKLKALADKLSNSSTDIDEVKKQIADLTEQGKMLTDKIDSIDLSKYVKQADLPDFDTFALKSDIPSLKDYAKTTDIPDVSNLASKDDIPSLDGLATESELKDYAKRSDIPDVSNLAKKSDIPDTSDFATKEDIPSLDGYAKTADVDKELDTKADKSDIPDTTGFALKTDIPDTSNFALKSDVPSLDGLAKTADVDKELATKADIANVYDKATIEDKIVVKANKSDVSDELAKKADKSTMADYLTNKADKTDLDPINTKIATLFKQVPQQNVPTLTDQNDLNNHIDGWAKCWGSLAKNAPDGCSPWAYFFEFTMSPAGSCLQVAIDVTNQTFSLRFCANHTWTPWVQFAFMDDLTNAINPVKQQLDALTKRVAKLENK